MQAFGLFLLLLEPVCEEETLLDTPLGRGRCIRDGLDQSITDIVRSITLDLVVFCHVHDRLVKFFLDHLVVPKPFSSHGEFSLDISITLACSAFKLVVFGFEHV